MDEQNESTESTLAQDDSARAVAPPWHTLVLIAAIVLLAVQQSLRGTAALHPVNRLATYGLAAVMDAAFVGWILFGLWLRKCTVRRLLGSFSISLRAMVRDVGAALLFWIVALFVLGSFAGLWAQTEARLQHRQLPTAQQPLGYQSPSQLETLDKLKSLAPANQQEVAAWIVLCVIVGFSEELIFRGYLQQQFIAAARGRVSVGVIASAVLFGAGHVYQGVRGVFLITIFGALFGLFVLYRRGLRAAMIAHAGHDLFAGLALAFLNAHHLI